MLTGLKGSNSRATERSERSSRLKTHVERIHVLREPCATFPDGLKDVILRNRQFYTSHFKGRSVRGAYNKLATITAPKLDLPLLWHFRTGDAQKGPQAPVEQFLEGFNNPNRFPLQHSVNRFEQAVFRFLQIDLKRFILFLLYVLLKLAGLAKKREENARFRLESSSIRSRHRPSRCCST
jgi:hypothetical protein